MSHDPRQREPRYPARLPITIRTGARAQEVVTANVSYRGLFACTDTPPVLRQLITIEAVLPPGDTRFVSHGMSVFVRQPADAGDLPPGVGIQFYAQGSPDRQNWEAFINHIKQGHRVAPAAKAPPTPVRRQHPRIAARLAVRPRSIDELKVLYTRDVSKGGMFLSTDAKLPLGSELRLEVYHPKTQQMFGLEAVVRRVNEVPPLGIGVEFIGLDDIRRDEFLHFVRDGAVTVTLDVSDFDDF